MGVVGVDGDTLVLSARSSEQARCALLLAHGYVPSACGGEWVTANMARPRTPSTVSMAST